MLGRLVCLVGFLAAIPLSQLQAAQSEELTADEVVRKCIEALGGKEQWDAVETMEVSGTFTTFSISHPFQLLRARPHRYRFEHHEGDRAVTIGFDGKIAWWDSEWTIWSGAAWPVETPAVYSRAIESEAIFGNPLLNYTESGHRVEFVGNSELDGETFLLVKVTLKNEAVEKWYLDPESFLPVVRLSEGADMGRPWEQKTFFSDYRDTDGILLPYYIETEVGNRLRIMEVEDVRTNVEIENHLFTLPPPVGMEKLRNLIGNWSAEVEYRNEPAHPWQSARFESTITSQFHGGLLEEDVSWMAAGRLYRLRRLWAYDRFTDVFRVIHFDNFTSHPNILHGEMVDGRLEVSNVATGTTWSLRGKSFNLREVTYDIQKDSFRVYWETSIDGGETWLTTARFNYSRVAGE